MKKYMFIFFIFLLNGCYYNFKTGCFYAPQSVNCGRKYKSDFDSYQKKGVTDEQKIIDMKSCLGKYDNNIDYRKYIFHYLYERYPNENIAHEFSMCMRNKGYIYDRLYR
ncbi:hypothetical protein ACLS0F_11555 [Avibacterium endocarditidis]|uniref:hypothetical protein n=1 Tax=Avibacterium endocarditidis TaxID=380674 RepID=UPI003BF90E48